MAYQTGLSRVSVSNIFLSLTNEGLIEKENGYLIVKDIQALKDYLIKDEEGRIAEYIGCLMQKNSVAVYNRHT